jgi:hypothetical protein
VTGPERMIRGNHRASRSWKDWGVKLRLGITLWILSWVPYGLIFGLSGAWLTAAWTVEILLGISGLAIAGTEFAQAVKDGGWKGAPAIAWNTMVHGKDIEATD